MDDAERLQQLFADVEPGTGGGGIVVEPLDAEQPGEMGLLFRLSHQP